ncbi:MAG: hydrogenase nickel incorporation protein HypB [bacterium]|nr:hydrogenase nickel incorporation protein HypB [bacterium]
MNRVEYRKRILEANDVQAAALRQSFAASGTLVVDVVSSPGAGKTSLLEATARALPAALRLGCVVGDIATEIDAERLRAAGMPSHQIVTGGACHLDARLVSDGLEAASFATTSEPLPLDVLFLENVGNLVCPASYDLGEDVKVVLLSVTEGHDKPFKYPAIFARAAVTLITKTDLLPFVDFQVDVVRDQVRALNAQAQILELSVKEGKGLDAWCGLLQQMLDEKRERATSV